MLVGLWGIAVGGVGLLVLDVGAGVVEGVVVVVLGLGRRLGVGLRRGVGLGIGLGIGAGRNEGEDEEDGEGREDLEEGLKGGAG